MSLSSCGWRLSVAPMAGVERQGRRSLRWGCRIPFRWAPTLSKETIPYPSYIPSSIRGKALEGEVLSLLEKGAIKLAPFPSPSYYSRLFVVMKAVEAGHRPFVTESEGSEDFFQDGDSPVGTSFGPGWRLDGVSRLERCVLTSSDASGLPQVPQVHNVREGVPVQGSLLWPVYGSAGFHTGHGSCFNFASPIRHSSSLISRRRACSSILPGAGSRCSGHSSPALSLAQIFVNWEKSQLIPTQRMVYLGVLLDSISFRASPAQKRVEKLLSIGDIFLSCEEQPVSSWLELSGVLSSTIQLVPGGRLRMRSLQLVLRRSWDHVDQSILIRWTPEICLDLEWWLNRARLE